MWNTIHEKIQHAMEEWGQPLVISNINDTSIIERNFRYDFAYGCAHFVVISTEHDFMMGSSQYQFIVSSLQSVNRSLTPWIILAGHRWECN